MFLFMKKKTWWLFLIDGVRLPQGYNENQFEEAVYVLYTIKFPEIVGTHFLSTSEV